jgi:hypothetical protein
MLTSVNAALTENKRRNRMHKQLEEDESKIG